MAILTKKASLIFYFGLFTCVTTAQSITKNQISSLGGVNYDPTNSLVLRDNLGEVIIGRLSSENGALQLGAGFIPSLEIEILSVPQNGYEYSVFPNPTSEKILVFHPTEPSYEYQIFDFSGRLLFKGRNLTQNEINFGNYSTGTYIVNITGDNGSVGQLKIIKK